jgi:hypothetical protein
MYHYLITVGIQGIDLSLAGKIYLDNFLSYNDKERKNVESCQKLSQDHLFKTSPEQSAEIFDCSRLLNDLQMILIRCKVQNTILLHYISEDQLDRHFFEEWVKSNSLEELKKAQVGKGGVLKDGHNL